MLRHNTVAVATHAIATPMCARDTKRVRFRHDVHPILQRTCGVFHRPDGVAYKMGGVSVATYEAVVKRARYGPMVTPGAKVQRTLVWLLKNDAGPSVAIPKVCEALDLKSTKCTVASRSPRRLPT